MSLIGLDLNATRARAVTGPAGTTPHALALEGTERDLPMLVSLQARRVQVGRPGLSLSRQLPHLLCADFLAHLGSPREWRGGRHRLDSTAAVAAVFEHLRPRCTVSNGIAFALPDYLSREQASTLPLLAGKARLPVLGAASASLAAAHSTFATSPWSGPAVVLDVDDHAFTCSLLISDQHETPRTLVAEMDEAPAEETATLSRVHARTLPELGMRAWKSRLLDALADRCIRHSRRDPRDSAPAEQMLYEQLEGVLDACWQEQLVEVAVQGEHWRQNLILRPEEVRAVCGGLVHQAREALHEALTLAEPHGVQRVLATDAAGRLPGLCETLQGELGEETPVVPLPADAAANGAHTLAAHFLHAGRPFEHLDVSLPCPTRPPLPAPKPPERKKRLFRF